MKSVRHGSRPAETRARSRRRRPCFPGARGIAVPPAACTCPYSRRVDPSGAITMPNPIPRSSTGTSSLGRNRKNTTLAAHCQNRAADHGNRLPERTPQDPIIDLFSQSKKASKERDAQPVPLCGAVSGSWTTSIGVRVSATNPEIRTATATVIAEFVEQPSDRSRQERQRHEHRDERDRRRDDRKADLLAPVERRPDCAVFPSPCAGRRSPARQWRRRRRVRSQARAPSSVRILIVNPAKYATASAPMMEIRDGERRDRGRAQTLEEGEHDKDHETHRDDQCLLDFIDRIIDEGGRIVCNVQLHPFGQRVSQDPGAPRGPLRPHQPCWLSTV